MARGSWLSALAVTVAVVSLGRWAQLDFVGQLTRPASPKVVRQGVGSKFPSHDWRMVAMDREDGFYGNRIDMDQHSPFLLPGTTSAFVGLKQLHCQIHIC